MVPFELRGLLVVRADLAERLALERVSVPHFPGNETWSALSCVNMTSMTPGRVMLPRRSNATDRIPGPRRMHLLHTLLRRHRRPHLGRPCRHRLGVGVPVHAAFSGSSRMMVMVVVEWW